MNSPRSLRNQRNFSDSQILMQSSSQNGDMALEGQKREPPGFHLVLDDFFAHAAGRTSICRQVDQTEPSAVPRIEVRPVALQLRCLCSSPRLVLDGDRVVRELKDDVYEAGHVSEVSRAVLSLDGSEGSLESFGQLEAIDEPLEERISLAVAPLRVQVSCDQVRKVVLLRVHDRDNVESRRQEAAKLCNGEAMASELLSQDSEKASTSLE